MATGRRLLTRTALALVAGSLAAGYSAGQDTQPTSTAAGGWELPPDVRAALARTEDFVFNVDQPGFYAVLDYVKHSPRSPGYEQKPLEIEDWREVLARPGDFRGRPITIQGIVGRKKTPYVLQSRRDLGEFWQLELYGPSQPVACSVILTRDAAGIPEGARITVTGYFIMVRNYYDSHNQVRQALLMAAPGPTTIGQPAPRGQSRAIWWWIVGAGVAGLFIAWVLLRRVTTGERTDPHTLRARHAAPISLAKDLDEWARDSDEGSERSGSDDH
jgi:hypothetical protein